MPTNCSKKAQMKHINLICHKAHLVSGSVNFIKELFKKEFTVDIIIGDQKLQHTRALLKNKTDAIFVLWQTEYLAPWLVSLGKKVVVFPMYDGCGNAPKSYFKILDHTYLFNFSKKLHQRCIDAGIVSYHLTYYPEPSNDKKQTKKISRLFYWLRRPNSSLSESFITELFSPFVDNIHIHDRPDQYKLDKSGSRVPDGFISTSNWFKRKKDLVSLISSSKYYLAPRESEGIGMAFLEAMNEGCIVFANRNSTHDQYIYDGYNGFLIDFTSGDKQLIQSQIEKAFNIINTGRAIGENARNFMQKGFPIWQAQSENLLKILKILDESDPHEKLRKSEQKIGYFLAYVYFIHPWTYFTLTDVFLKLGFFSDKFFRLNITIIYYLFKKIFRRIRR